MATKAKFLLKIGKRPDQEALEEKKQIQLEKKAKQKLKKQEQKNKQEAENQDWLKNDEKSEYEKIMVRIFYLI